MRRREILGLGGMSLAGSVVLGTGAFNISRTDRSIMVGIEEDYDAYLQLEEIGKGDRSEVDGRRLRLNIPGDDEDDYNHLNPEGVGSDSVYWFGRDAGGESGDGLFRITNKGTGPVRIFSTQSTTTEVPLITTFKVDNEKPLTEGNPSGPLNVGDSIRCGIRMNTHGVEVRDDAYDITLTINAHSISE